MLSSANSILIEASWVLKDLLLLLRLHPNIVYDFKIQYSRHLYSIAYI
jgi:hypothetical protein